jgi:2-oxoglutarate dehydrogenase E1 component
MLHQECQQLQERMEVEYRPAFSPDPHHETQQWANGNSACDSDEDNWLDFLAHPSSSDGITGVGLQELKAALSIISEIPDGFTLPPPTERAVLQRAELLEMLNSDNTGSSPEIDWATAELLALCTLGQERHFCRLSGQDSQRGTLTQRHAVWHDSITGQMHHALPPLVQVVDTPLSELGVLGFEHGVSLASPNFLVLWEAQLGDFSNNCQVLIDTMISSEKEKFGLESNLVLLLPHGYDGMGPEHSSSRLERFLTLHTDTPEAAEQPNDDLERFRKANFTVIYPSTPSNYFHVLRRSFSWPFRRPMVVLTPKRTLRLAMARSPVTEFLRDGGSQVAFLPVLNDPRTTLDSRQVKSIALCSGEIFYDVLNLLQDLPEEDSQTVAIVRVEQLASFPLRQLRAVIKHYPFAHRAVWMQEEPYNMGALRFTAPFLERMGIPLSAPISRCISAAPAVGNPRDHETSQLDLLSRITDWIQQGSKAADMIF